MAAAFAAMAIRWALDTLSSMAPRLLTSLPATSATNSSSHGMGMEDIRKLERTMHRINAVLQDAEDHWSMRDELSKLRLRELKQVAYDAQDIVEEYEYSLTQFKLQDSDRARSGIKGRHHKRKHQDVSKVEMHTTPLFSSRSSFVGFWFVLRYVNKDHSVDTKIIQIPEELNSRARKVRERFDEIIKDFTDLHLSENDGECYNVIQSERHTTSSIIVERSIVGREQDQRNIVEMLSCDGTNADSLNVLAIVGMGGLGKTTLAQMVYNDEKVQKNFNLRAWVCVSEHYDVKNITRNIITSLTMERCDLTEFADLQAALVQKIKGKSFLLVLDDLWNDRPSCWESLCKPMRSTSTCTIVVTTRQMEVARIVQTMHPYKLNCLSHQQSWLLFRKSAFQGREAMMQQNIVEIGQKIIDKCKGLPLAVKTLGGMLRYESNEERWNDVLENEVWDMKQARDGVLPALELSYKHMPGYLKRCFVALSLFPKDYRFGKYEVIPLWKSLGLLHPDARNNEDNIGYHYLSELVQRSILECQGDGYIMHDLTNDLASYVAGDEFLRLDEEVAEISPDVRYMSIMSASGSKTGSPQIPNGSSSLRAIIVMCKDDADMEVPDGLLLQFTQLRSVLLQGVTLSKALLCSVSNLKLLRYLRIADSEAESFHLSFSKLYNMRELDLISNPFDFVAGGIGQLVNLQTLALFTVWTCDCHPSIIELRNLNNIKGRLCIRGLGNVSRAEDAKEADLQSKSKLQQLVLVFTQENHFLGCVYKQRSKNVAVSHEMILENLQPNCNLRELIVIGYRCHCYPKWFGSVSFSKMTKLTLSECESNQIPTLGQLPSLQSLSVSTMHILKYIGREFCGVDPGVKGFQVLKELSFESMTTWLEWHGVEDSEFPCLRTLDVCTAPRLQSLPLAYFSSLVDLKLLVCNSLVEIPTLPLLNVLYVTSCDNLTELPCFPSLRELHMFSCSSLAQLHDLPSLQSLQIQHLPLLAKLSCLSSLTSIHLGGAFRCQLLYDLLSSSLSLEKASIISEDVTWICLEPSKVPQLTTLQLSCPRLEYCDHLDGLTSLREL
ncbi:hypothetical protein U9M48_007789 [Paspalum notatum var. saurae]|uniref:Uncharacterized protein n=1 Tax=Paspalum notatum var. saurae TaxID=547442 RepID=A0AAQ3WCG5_PASNO